MTERDLWSYRAAIKRKKRAEEKLEEFEARIYSPASQRFSAEMRSDSRDSDKLSAITEKHNDLLLKVYFAASDAATAFSLLEQVDTLLCEKERDFLHYRYRLGFSWNKLEKTLGISHDTAKRRRKNILEKI